MNPQFDETASQVVPEGEQATRSRMDVLSALGSTKPHGASPTGKVPSIEGYHLERELGRGGMGVVYLALELKLNRPVALKMLLHAAHARESDQARFLSEAEAIARLNHPHIVPIFSLGQAEAIPFFAMEYLDGGSLSDLIRDNPLEPKRAAEIVEKLALATHYAHTREIVHRDLKPSNVLFTTSGEPKITDFGLAKRLDAGEGITLSGQIMGTPSYMAPEQARGENDRVNASTDVYALGAILYHLLTGRPPFLGPSSQATINQVIQQTPVSPRELQASIPRDLETICLKCLRKASVDRYPSAEALAQDLRAFLEMRTISARPVGRIEQATKWVRRNPSWARMIFLFVATLLTGMGVSLYFADAARSEADRAKKAAKAEADRAKELGIERDKTRAALEKVTLAENAEKQKAADLSKALDAANENLWDASKLRLRNASFLWNGSGNPQECVDLLDAIPERFRKFEWGWLKGTYQGGYATLYGHTGSVNTVSFSADGTRLASGSADNTIWVWDVQSGQRLLQLHGHTSAVNWVSFFPDGSRLASISLDSVRIWDTTTGQCLLIHRLFGGDSLSISPDGSRLATAFQDSIWVWDAKTGQSLLQLKGHTARVSSLSFSPDGSRLASAESWGGETIRIWDTKTGQSLVQLQGVISPVTGVNFSPDGSRLAAASGDTIRIWDATTGESLRQLRAHTSAVTTVHFSIDGSRLASASKDKTIRIWDAKTGQSLLQLKGHTEMVTSVRFSPDGNRLASGSADKSIRFWDTKTGQNLMEIQGHSDVVTGVVFSPDGSRLASASWDRMIRLWDTNTGRSLLQLQGHTDALTSVTFSPNGSHLASGSADRTIRVWDAKTGQHLTELKGHSGAVYGISFSTDFSRLASASDDNTVRVWDTKSAQSLAELKGHTSSVNSVSFSPDGNRLASGSSDQTIRVWDAKTGESLLELKGHTGYVWSVSFSPDGSRLVSGSSDSTIRIWDAATGQALLELKGHADGVTGVRFSGDGSRLVSGSWDRTIRVWDAVSGQSLLELKGHLGAVNGVTFSRDGRRVASGSSDKRIRIWSPPESVTLLQLHGRSDREQNVTLSPDGSRLASVSADRTIRVWDTQTGQFLVELKGHSGLTRIVSFSPDGSRLGSLLDDHRTFRVWDASTGQRVADEMKPPGWMANRSSPGVISPAGRFIWIGQSDGRIIRTPLEISDDELAFRRAMWRPNPTWHQQQLDAAKKANDSFAERVQTYLLHKATAEEHFDYNRWDQAFYWSFAAQLLKPKPPVIDWPELLPRPKELP
jgi:WD40 repeat protein/predicted Ser/Thr protein kinase